MPPKPDEVIQKIGGNGFYETPDKSGHRVFVHSDGRKAIVPFHRKKLKKGTWKSILKQLGLTEEEYRRL